MSTAVLTEPVSTPSAWRGDEMSASTEWVQHWTPEQIEELSTAADSVLSRGLTLHQMTKEDFQLPTIAPMMTQVADELENGRGFVLLRGLPVEEWGEEKSSVVYYGMGLYMGVTVSQNAAGDLLGHVRDQGLDLSKPHVRGYQTSAKLPFHTDGSDVVGLLCLKKAKSGGLSSISSSTTVYNMMLERAPELAELLYQPFFYDRREEQNEGEKPYYPAPIYSWYDGKLSARYIRGFIQSAMRFPELPRLTEQQLAALDLMDELAASPECRIDMELEVGDIQLINNYVILHSRTEYEDFPDPAQRRHLLRLWLTLDNGRALAPDFGRTSGADSRGRGGIAAKQAG